MEDSIFTRIIKGEIPAHRIYEDDRTLAFLDICPQTEGQTVVIPKKQVPFVWDLEEADYQALMATVQKVGRQLRELLPNAQRIGIAVEGLDVKDHAHVKLIPFSTAKEFRDFPDMSAEPDHAVLASLAEKLKLS